MRFLLDAHVSGRRVGRPLQERRYDVLALDSDPQLAGLADDEVLELARQEERVIVTHDVKDFAPLTREAAEGGRRHAGCILALLPTNAHGAALRGLDALVVEHPNQDDWLNRIEFLA